MSRPVRLTLHPLEDRLAPATFTVTTPLDVVDPADGKRSLREAITAANGRPGADLIVVPKGTFAVEIGGPFENANATGDFDVTDSVTIRGAGRNLTYVDAGQLDRAFHVRGSAPGSIQVTLDRLTVRNGAVSGPGGGVAVQGATLIVRDAAVTGNRATGDDGGGIWGDVGAPQITLLRSTVARNVATGGHSGGGVFMLGTLAAQDSQIQRNIATGSGGGFDVGTAILTNCTVSGNTSTGSAGGVLAGTATLTNCTVSGNSAALFGGGIFASRGTVTGCTIGGNAAAFGAGMFASTATLTNCTVSGNSAGNDGGGILASTAVTLTNCTVSGNSARNDGGGVHAVSATLTNCTVAENLARGGGGLYHEPGGGAFNLRNSIVALNLVLPGGFGPDVFGEFASLGHNLIGTGDSAAGFVGTDLVGTAIEPIDPKLGPLGSNGGRTQTYRLLAGSPAIDAGDNTDLSTTDQRGLARKKDGNGDGRAVVDIGAFER